MRENFQKKTPLVDFSFSNDGLKAYNFTKSKLEIVYSIIKQTKQ